MWLFFAASQNAHTGGAQANLAMLDRADWIGLLIFVIAAVAFAMWKSRQ